jgi:hypothetical protein
MNPSFGKSLNILVFTVIILIVGQVKDEQFNHSSV